MSRRFGRQQKRKLKEQLAIEQALRKEQLAIEQALRKWYVKNYEVVKRDYEHIVSQIEAIQPYSVVMPVKQLYGDPDRYPVYRIAQHKNFMLERIDSSIPEHCIVDEEKVYRLDVTLTENPNFDKQIHLKLGNITKAGYYMSESAFYQQGPPITYLAKKIAYELNRHIKNGK